MRKTRSLFLYKNNRGGGLSADRLDAAAHVVGDGEVHVANALGLELAGVAGHILPGVLLGLVKGHAGNLALGEVLHSRVELLVGKIVVEIDVADHGHLEVLGMTVVTVGIVADEHVTGQTHEDGIDVDGPQKRGEEHAAVDTVDLNGGEGVVKGTHTLGIDDIARKGTLTDAAVLEAAALEDIPQGIDLTLDPCGVSLIAHKAIDGAGGESFPQYLVNHGIVLIDIAGEKLTGIDEAALVAGGIILEVAEEALVDAPDGEGAHGFLLVLPVDADADYDAEGRGLDVSAQGLIVPHDVGINSVQGGGPRQDELADGTTEEGSLLDFYPDSRIASAGTQADTDERIGIADIEGVYGLDEGLAGGGGGDDLGGEDVAGEGVDNLDVGTSEETAVGPHADDDQDDKGEENIEFTTADGHEDGDHLVLASAAPDGTSGG